MGHKTYAPEEKNMICEYLKAGMNRRAIATTMNRKYKSLCSEIQSGGGSKNYNPNWMDSRIIFNPLERERINRLFREEKSIHEVADIMNCKAVDLRNFKNRYNKSDKLTNKEENEIKLRLDNLEFQVEILVETIKDIRSNLYD